MAAMEPLVWCAALMLPSLYLVYGEFEKRNDIFWEIFASIVFGVFGFVVTSVAIPKTKEYLVRRGLVGKDLCKKGMKGGEKIIPEAMGIVPGVSFLVCIIFCQIFYAYSRDAVKMGCKKK
uniref:Uncharacterized protein n=1 Tax=Fibrocapsa japonica TaxID=94617 RepID=A0A7S2Y1J2_9STRA|mmetsp:Transcript_9302/g.14273  ORF Transcript_9302/g.14273 Transcript_9302/m.14273 type:complete len:120 (+) Transcript_9302:69-428(+)|eukprot:CAMPEP_0113937956 /NCGR_PEP_ID=MMETSP1339-20121228/4428_1 /TAXON_ID=94617 /ORGANISM="Fibrocapsa japonica" /LENGTH=119 /DNA_ID=CAMNT_0000940879 /DNA_START=69 /DNA_END=428 /DNA_ORIENTATION=- /assembly_acc=CAM_ASM_000762